MKLSLRAVLSLLLPLLVLSACSDETVPLKTAAISSTHPAIISTTTITTDNHKTIVPLPPTPTHHKFHNLPVLMFHYIRTVDRTKDLLGYNLSLEPASFDKLLNALVKKGYHTVHAEDLLTDQPLPTNPIILSFDDGYADFYSNAWPDLQKHNFTASTAIITGFMQADHLGQTYMNADQVKTLDQNGIEIFSHTVSHADLSKDPRQQAEIENSKTILEKLLGHAVTVLVYPSGKYNADTIKIATAAGYKMAFTTHPGLADFSLNDFEQPRVRVDNRQSIDQIIAKL